MHHVSKALAGASKYPTLEEAEEVMRRLDCSRPSRPDVVQTLPQAHHSVMICPWKCGSRRCCLGCLSLQQGALLIAFIETVLLAIFVLHSSYLVVNNGMIFYTTELVGLGSSIAMAIACYTIIGVFVLCCLVLALKLRSALLLIPHIIFQWLTVCLLAMTIYMVYDRTQPGTPAPYLIRFPSACVLIVLCAIPAVVIFWWSVVLSELWLTLRCNKLSLDEPFSPTGERHKQQRDQRLQIEITVQSATDTDIATSNALSAETREQVLMTSEDDL